MNVSIIGLGYIGIPLATLLVQSGHKVFGFDNNQEVIEKINKGISKINEDDLIALLKESIKSGKLTAKNFIESSDVYVITVPTPIKFDNTPDLDAIYEAVDSIIPILKLNQMVVIESTVPVGTSEKVTSYIARARQDLTSEKNELRISVAYCPERILPGDTLNELKKNDRIIGGVTADCTEKAKRFYETFLDVNCYETDSNTAEFVKLSENAFRDLNVAFANDLSMLSKAWDIDVFEVIKLANKHPRVDILQPGAGVGGHCLAVDPLFLLSNNHQHGETIKAARFVNDKKPEFIVEQLRELATSCTHKKISDLSIAILGITYKPNSNDLRNSPALKVAEKVTKIAFKNIFIAEPNLVSLPNNLNLPYVSLKNVDQCLKDADIALVLVSHDQFLEVTNSSFANIRCLDTVGLLNKIVD